jgi:hypothetical protein
VDQRGGTDQKQRPGRDGQARLHVHLEREEHADRQDADAGDDQPLEDRPHSAIGLGPLFLDALLGGCGLGLPGIALLGKGLRGGVGLSKFRHDHLNHDLGFAGDFGDGLAGDHQFRGHVVL